MASEQGRLGQTDSRPPDLGSAEFFRDPFATYDWLRERQPVFHDPARGDWFLTRHADILTVLKDPRLRHVPPPDAPPPVWAEPPAGLPPGGDKLFAIRRESQHLHSLWMGLHDPADHVRLRALLAPAVGPARIAAMLPRVQALADHLVDQVEATGRMDLIADFANPLAITVISDVLGVPPQPRQQFVKWSRDLEKILDPYSSPLDRERALLAIYRYADFFKGLLAQRRAHRQSDFLSGLVTAQEQGRLSADELLAHCVDLFFSGHQSTGYFLANAVLALLKQPDQLQLLKDNPALVPNAIEELLRFGTTIMMTTRIPHAPFEVGGQAIEKGQHLRLVLGAANRDPARFASPHQIDLTRSPNPHVTFGHGVHYCLGAPLARAEAQVLLATLVRRLPNLKLSEAALEWEPSFLVRGLKALPVEFR